MPEDLQLRARQRMRGRSQRLAPVPEDRGAAGAADAPARRCQRAAARADCAPPQRLHAPPCPVQRPLPSPAVPPSLELPPRARVGPALLRDCAAAAAARADCATAGDPDDPDDPELVDTATYTGPAA